MQTALALILQSAALPAAEKARLTTGTAPDLTWLMVVAGVLVVVIGAIAYGFKRIVLKQLDARASKRDLAVLEILPLGGKRQLAVVRCFDRTFALGLGEKDVTLVAELDHGAIALDRAKRTAAEPAGSNDAFRARLEAAKAQLLGFRELIPAGRGGTQREVLEPGEVSTPRPGSEREFIA